MFEFSNKVLPSVKLALREASNDFDEDIKADIESCALDLENAGILFYFFDTSRENFEVDPLILRAVKWYCMSVYGLANPDMEKYDQAYRSLKATLATQARYRRDPDEKLRDAEIQEIRNLIRSLDLRIAGLEDIDTTLSSTSPKAVQNKVITQNIDRIDQRVLLAEQEIENVKEIARGKPNSESFIDYMAMVNILNSLPADSLKVNDNILIATAGIPDFWIFSVEQDKVSYVYTDDQTLAQEAEQAPVQVGYYKISPLDGFNKQTLEKYLEKKDAIYVEAYLKDNGAYTIVITKGLNNGS